jgi:hypothetical protein
VIVSPFTLPWWSYMPDPVPAQGGAPAANAEHSASAPVVVTRKETDAFTLRLIGRYGSVEAALTNVAGEQLRYRRRAQKAEATAAELQKKVPAADAVVLTGDEAKAYGTLKTLGVTLDKIPASLDSLKALQSKDSTMTRESALTMAAGKNYKVKVLKKLLGDIPLEFKTVNVKTTGDDGKPKIEEQKVAYVVLGEGATQTREALDTYLEREHEDFMDVLLVEEREGETTTERKEAKSPANAVTVPVQRALGGRTPPNKGDDMSKIVDKTLGGKYQTPSQRRQAASGSTQ